MILLQVIGRLGKDATTNVVNGKTVINFSVANSEKYKNAQGEMMEKTTWVECSYWTDSRVVDYLRKGIQVYCEGSPEARAYQTNNGEARASLSLRVRSVQLLSSSEQTSQNAPQQSAGSSQTHVEGGDDLPF